MTGVKDKAQASVVHPVCTTDVYHWRHAPTPKLLNLLNNENVAGAPGAPLVYEQQSGRTITTRDALVVTKLDRLTRSMANLWEVTDKLKPGVLD